MSGSGGSGCGEGGSLLAPAPWQVCGGVLPCSWSLGHCEYESLIYLVACGLQSCSLSGAASVTLGMTWCFFHVKCSATECISEGCVAQHGMSCSESSSPIKFRIFLSVVLSLYLLALKLCMTCRDNLPLSQVVSSSI